MTGENSKLSPEWMDNIMEAVGDTPLVRLKTFSKLCGCTILAKVEGLNPGLSAKDRIALEIIDQAEKAGKIKPGGTFVESTSGNTGFALAMACIVRDYKCILAIPDKSSEEKIQQLRAMGATVLVCPSNVSSGDPLSYYSQAKTASENIPNSFYVNQYFNNANFDAHYKSTGPELWRQSGGLITHFVATVGTGGTISGTATYLKEQNPDIKIIGVDADGSILTKYHESGKVDMSESHPYLLEGVGKGMIPGNIDFDIIDRFIKVDDKNSAFRTRQLAKREAIFAGYSSGAAIQAILQLRRLWQPEHVVVVLLPDHGSKYMSKVYNDGWMQRQGFIRSLSKYANSYKIQKRLEKVITKYVKYGSV